MSHAWNACGVHAPRGFKSHILRHRKSRLLLHSMEPGFLLYTGARPRWPLIDDRWLVAIRLKPCDVRRRIHPPFGARPEESLGDLGLGICLLYTSDAADE